MQEILSKKNVGIRLRKIRNKNGLSQEKVADVLGLSRSNYSQIELGKQYPTYQVLVKLSKYYNRSYEWFLHGEDALKPNISIHSDGTDDGDIDSPNLVRRTIKNMGFVDHGAKTAYVNKLHSKTFLGNLPQISVPLNTPAEGSYRAFEVSGNSMKDSLQESDIIIGELLTDFEDITATDIYVIITSREVLIRRLISYTAETGLLFYSSDSHGAGTCALQVEEVAELWKAVGKYSEKISRVIEDIGFHVSRFDATLYDLKAEVDKLKSKVEIQD